MYGHEGVTRDLRRRLLDKLPDHLNAIRVSRTATLGTLPNPTQILPHFIPDIDVDSYPTVAISELDTPNGLTGAREVRQGTRFDSYVYRYPFRIWIYVRSVGYGITELQLKRYMTALRTVILENRVLVDNDDAHVTFDPETLTENFDAAMEDANRQVLGVGFIGVVLESAESINLTVDDPRADLPTDIDGAVTVLDRFTGVPTGEPVIIPEDDQ